MQGAPTPSLAAIRMMGRCRWITSSGRSRARTARSFWIPASTKRWGRSGGRQFLRSPAVGLKAIGVEPDDVRDVILSHMHYDHCGNYDLFPHARYHLQDIEMAYCTGRCMCHPGLRGPFEEEDVVAIVRKLFAGRVVFHDGVDELAPGITLHHVGGHSKGLQVCAYGRGAAGWCWPPTPATSMPTCRRAARFRSCTATKPRWRAMRPCANWPARRTQSFRATIRLVQQRYPAAKPGLEGIAVRLDVDPKP